MSSVEDIVAWLQSLPPNGKDGFEGLVAGLFEKLSGYRFHLARSGSQFGRDAGTYDGPSIVMETKRYSSSSNLNARELHGELEEAQQRTPELELRFQDCCPRWGRRLRKILAGCRVG